MTSGKPSVAAVCLGSGVQRRLSTTRECNRWAPLLLSLPVITISMRPPQSATVKYIVKSLATNETLLLLASNEASSGNANGVIADDDECLLGMLVSMPVTMAWARTSMSLSLGRSPICHRTLTPPAKPPTCTTSMLPWL